MTATARASGPCRRSCRSSPVLLIGRSTDLALIDALLEAAPVRGSTLVLRGEAGVAKSVLLDAAQDAAHAVLALAREGFTLAGASPWRARAEHMLVELEAQERSTSAAP